MVSPKIKNWQLGHVPGSSCNPKCDINNKQKLKSELKINVGS